MINRQNIGDEYCLLSSLHAYNGFLISMGTCFHYLRLAILIFSNPRAKGCIACDDDYVHKCILFLTNKLKALMKSTSKWYLEVDFTSVGVKWPHHVWLREGQMFNANYFIPLEKIAASNRLGQPGTKCSSITFILLGNLKTVA